MYGAALLLTLAAVGVDYGWQPGEDGQLEYIIQIEPELVKTLSEGKVDLLSEIPPELQGVKRFRIRVGTGAVPREGLKEVQAANIRPEDDIAFQQPNLNGQQLPANDPRAVGTRRPTDTRGSPLAQPGSKVLNPPASNDPTQPLGNTRFNDTTGGGNFPTVGNTPGIGRTASLPRNANDPTEPLNDRTAVDLQSPANANTRAPTPVWDNATQQWRTPQTNPATNNPITNTQDPRNLPAAQDPRYATDPRTGLPEVRNNTTQDPRAYNPNPAYPVNNGYPANNNYNAPRPNQSGQWNNQAPGYAPLRDPDPGYYPPPMYASRPEAQYDPNMPMNRQVGYQVAANTQNPAPAATGNQPTSPTTNTTATGSNVVKPGATLPSARDFDRFDDTNKPWWPLTFTAMLLFGSIGLNFYLGWIAHGIYNRYRALLMEVRNVRAATI